jgi:hypothetical protein
MHPPRASETVKLCDSDNFDQAATQTVSCEKSGLTS